MKSILASAPFALVLFVSGCVEPADISRQVPVSKDFKHAGGAWTIGHNGIDIRLAAIESPDGFVEICGAYDSYGTVASQYTYTMMRAYSVIANGTPIVNDLTYFTKVTNAAQLETAQANCKVTAMPWGKDAPKLRVVNANNGKRYKL